MSARSDENMFKNEFGNNVKSFGNAPKKTKINKKRSNNKKPSSNSTIFDKVGKKQKQNIKYENVRVQTPVFNEMRKAQYTLNLSSRSELIHLMYKYCQDAIYKTPDHQKRAKHFDQIEKAKSEK